MTHVTIGHNIKFNFLNNLCDHKWTEEKPMKKIQGKLYFKNVTKWYLFSPNSKWTEEKTQERNHERVPSKNVVFIYMQY